MYQPSQRELRVLRAVIDTGSFKAAGHVLGRSETAIKNVMFILRRKAGVESNYRLVYDYRDAVSL